MIALGYILTFGWVFLVLGLTLLLKKKTGADDEVSRKIVHVLVAFAYLPMYFCFGMTWHLLVPPAVFIVLNAVSYRRGLFAAMERTDESKKSLGTVYYAVSMTVMVALCLAAPFRRATDVCWDSGRCTARSAFWRSAFWWPRPSTRCSGWGSPSGRCR